MIAIQAASSIARPLRVSASTLLVGLMFPAFALADAVPPDRSVADSGAAPVPPYRSLLDDYRRYRSDEPPVDWRDANELAGRLRGHGGHLAPSAPADGAEPER